MLKIGQLFAAVIILSLVLLTSVNVNAIEPISKDSIYNSGYDLENTINSLGMLGRNGIVSPYGQPYSFTGNSYDWHRLWINTATLSSAFVGTLLVLECLPEDATSWNRSELQDVPLFKRWHNHVIKKALSGIMIISVLITYCILMPGLHISWLHVLADLIFGGQCSTDPLYLP